MPNDNTTHIAFLLDRSGSMQSIKDDVIGGFNALVADQRETPGDCTLTLVQFDSQDPQETVFSTLPIAEVPELTGETFQPRGGTPLLDAMGRLITETGERIASTPEHQHPGKVIFVVLTDGLENASRTYTRERIFEMIKHQREVYSWEFIFLGADQDAIAEGGKYGFAADTSMSIGKTPRGTDMAFSMTSDMMCRIRKSKGTAAAAGAGFSEADRARQTEEIKKQKRGGRHASPTA